MGVAKQDLLRALESLKQEIIKQSTKSFKMTAGLELNDSDPQATMAPELTFNLRKQNTAGNNENFSLGTNVIVHLYSKDLAAYLSLPE